MLKLLQPDTSRITPAEHRPTHDRAPEELAQGTPAWLRQDLEGMLGKGQVHGRVSDLIRYATDASPYRLFPKVVVSPRSLEEVAKIFAYAREKKLSVTIRAAGSSLSGQAQGDGILIDARKHWAGCTVEQGGRRLRVRPGTVMFRANLALKSYGYRLGPDPASSGVATIGGVIANNASGMCCGTVENSYKTLESVSFLLPSGTYINTAEADAERQFVLAEPELAKGLLDIKQEIERDRFGFRMIWPVHVVPRFGIPRATSTATNLWPTRLSRRCGSGATEQNFPSCVTRAPALLVSQVRSYLISPFRIWSDTRSLK
jgi:D-lactate dehydrogenase